VGRGAAGVTAAARVCSTIALLTGKLPFTLRISGSGDSMVIFAAANSSKKRLLRSIPPMRWSCTMKIGVRENVEISFASATSFSGERMPLQVRQKVPAVEVTFAPVLTCGEGVR
jgi:hypothetical protein